METPCKLFNGLFSGVLRNSAADCATVKSRLLGQKFQNALNPRSLQLLGCLCACLLVCLPYLSLCLRLSLQAEADLCVAKERSREKEDNTLVVHLVCVRTLVHKSVSPDVILCG